MNDATVDDRYNSISILQMEARTQHLIEVLAELPQMTTDICRHVSQRKVDLAVSALRSSASNRATNSTIPRLLNCGEIICGAVSQGTGSVCSFAPALHRGS
ncbi:hypothetical protein A0H81_11965 [Grifola frondosa]|uniref:Uncharacterized protein n=1 Tax=Grifola frondosa TaxID=5627 RepID=A0A1C7LVI2_GRIFR|nr:hypothetical protein A0H81_11965 [Grifola frondosa]